MRQVSGPEAPPGSMTVKAPRFPAIVALGVALFGLYVAFLAAQEQDWKGVIMFAGGAPFVLAFARLLASPRVIGTPEGLAHPRGLLTWADQFVPWEDVVEAQFILQTAMAWPILVLQVRGEKEALYIRFPLVNLDKRARMMAYIQERIEAAKAAKARETAPEHPRGNHP